MQNLTRTEVMASFPKKGRKLVVFPRDFDEINWANLDFLGWIDIGSARGFMVFEHRGCVRGLVFKRSSPFKTNRVRMCSLCKTIHSKQGIRSFVTENPQDSNKVFGDEYCEDLLCSLRVRRLVHVPPNQMQETLSVDEKAFRVSEEVEALFDRCYGTL